MFLNINTANYLGTGEQARNGVGAQTLDRRVYHNYS